MIQGTYYKEWSRVLGRDMEFKVYGTAGVPVLALPARGGRFYDWENNGMPDAIAQLLNEGHFDMGTYFGNCTSGGNNYEACIVTAQNALKDYPYSNRREEFASLIMKGKYELAKMSVEKKQLERYQDAEDECYGFINEYPDSKDRALAEKYIEKCKQYEKEHPESALDQLGNNAN